MTEDKHTRKLEQQAKWRATHRLELREYHKTLRRRLRDKFNAYHRAFYAANKHKWREYVARNREAVRKQKALYHEKHKEELNSQARAYGKTCRRRNAAIVRKAKAGGCVDCGIKDPRVLDFDHIHGAKLASIAKLAGTAGLPTRLLNEIAKCEVRCANCHRITTAERRRK